MCHEVKNFYHRPFLKYDNKLLGIKRFNVKDDVLYSYYSRYMDYDYRIDGDLIYIKEKVAVKQEVSFDYSFIYLVDINSHIGLFTEDITINKVVNGIHVAPVFMLNDSYVDEVGHSLRLTKREFNKYYYVSIPFIEKGNDKKVISINIFVEIEEQDMTFISFDSISVKELKLLTPEEQIEVSNRISDVLTNEIYHSQDLTHSEIVWNEEAINKIYGRIYKNIKSKFKG